ncbi:MAG: hypothetical protein U0T84_09920 [Chitinophagales bacterium]
MMKKIHYLSGLTISVFVVFHLVNHFGAFNGAAAHIALMNTFRELYRNPIVEPALILLFLTQTISGINLFLKIPASQQGWMLLKKWSGLYLVFFLLIHLSAVFFGRVVLKLDTNFYFGVAGLNAFPVCLFFIPYYGLAVGSFFTHVAAIHHSKMRAQLLGLSPQTQSKIIMTMGWCLAILLLLVLTNFGNGFTVPAAYAVLTQWPF